MKRARSDVSKNCLGNAAQFFVAGELSRRGVVAALTLGNCPDTDILCSSADATKFAYVQVKTFLPGRRKCIVGMRAEKPYGKGFFWVLAGIPESGSGFQYYIIPAAEMARHVGKGHDMWKATVGRSGQPHQTSKVRTVALPPHKSRDGWSIEEYKDQWEAITEHLASTTGGVR